MSDGQRLGLIVDGVDIFKKWKIKVKSRDLGKPNKKKSLESVAHSSQVLDFSSLYGGDNYEERSLTYTLNIKGTKPDRMTAHILETEFSNFLMNKQQFKLVDELFPDYYFLAEVREGTNFSPLFNFGELTVTFTAYAFRIKTVAEGSLYWDDYSILDYYQETKFYTKRTTFKSLSIGSVGTVGAWSTQYDGLERIPQRFLGESYTITDKKSTDQGVSNYTYYLAGLNKWVIEQDMVQAQNGAITVNILNTDGNGVTPKIITDGAITILRGNEVYNVWTGTTQDDLFQLNEGNNYLNITGINRNVEIQFHKELI